MSQWVEVLVSWRLSHAFATLSVREYGEVMKVDQDKGGGRLELEDKLRSDSQTQLIFEH